MARSSTKQALLVLESLVLAGSSTKQALLVLEDSHRCTGAKVAEVPRGRRWQKEDIIGRMIIFVLDILKLYKAMRDIAKYLCLGLWLAEIRHTRQSTAE